MKKTIEVPDLGGAEEVEVIEVLVAVGDEIAADDSLVVLESDKASVEVPAPAAGKVLELKLTVGDMVAEGAPILVLEQDDESEEASQGEQAEPEAKQPETNQEQTARGHDSKKDASDGGDKKDTPAEQAAGKAVESVSVPDIGGAEKVDVIEVCVAAGDTLAEGDSMIVLESDKASMEIPAPRGGTVKSVSVKEGDKLSEGDAILELESESAAPAIQSGATGDSDAKPDAKGAGEKKSEATSDAAPSAEPTVETVRIPDIGGAEKVDVIEVSVKAGAEIEEGDSMIVLESDKASMEIPAPRAGTVQSVTVKEGDKLSEGDAILELLVQPAAKQAPDSTSAPAASASQSSDKSRADSAAAKPGGSSAKSSHATETPPAGAGVYAGPAVRKLARELGVDLNKISGNGPRGRILKEDVQDFVKEALSGDGARGGIGIPQVPDVDHSEFGEIDVRPMSKLHQVTARNMQRSWLNVPHVTQFDDADITDLEEFRAGLKRDAEQRGTRLTPLPFLIKAAAAALRAHPSFNAALHSDGESLVFKKYVHIGFAVDTDAGLMVPVIRDVDRKNVWEIAAEAAELAQLAKDRKLKPAQMKGGCFTISSLGPIGGTGFTPIVNTPEVAILAVSRAEIRPVWNGSEFVPRKMLPLGLSYDHRAVNGADAGRFMTDLVGMLGDIRRLLL